MIESTQINQEQTEKGVCFHCGALTGGQVWDKVADHVPDKIFLCEECAAEIPCCDLGKNH